MDMEKAQAVTECAGKEALSGPREAFTRHSSANPSPRLSQGLLDEALGELVAPMPCYFMPRRNGGHSKTMGVPGILC
jgi:hypothetical protein